jgi:hypothetical protein
VQGNNFAAQILVNFVVSCSGAPPIQKNAYARVIGGAPFLGCDLLHSVELLAKSICTAAARQSLMVRVSPVNLGITIGMVFID